MTSTTVGGAKRPADRRPEPSRTWTFLTNHAHVLLALTRNPDMRVSEIARTTGISERYAYRVLNDLEEAGYVDRDRNGRCNAYRIDTELAFGDPVVEERFLRDLLRLIGQPEDDTEPLAAA